MTTLIAAYDDNGCNGRCDAKCYNAKHPECTCICCGENHGKGLEQAIGNTNQMAAEWIKQWSDLHPQTTKWTVIDRGNQLMLFNEE